MASTVRCRRPVSTMVAFLNLAGTRAKKAFAIFTTLAFALNCIVSNSAAAQEPQPQSSQENQRQNQAPASESPANNSTTSQQSDNSKSATVTIPAGANFALVLTNPVSS